MTLLVPFDGSELAEAALVRAVEFSRVFEEDVLALTVIPRGNVQYARERDWLDDDEEFSMSQVVGSVHEQVTDLCPSADFQHVDVDRYAPAGTISHRIRRVAREEDVSMVFVGSDNAGSFVSSISSVGSSVASEDAYDVVIVRDRSPAKVQTLREQSPHSREKSEFYLPE